MSTRKRYIPRPGHIVEQRMRPAGFATKDLWFSHVVERLCAWHRPGREERLRDRYRWLLQDGKFYPTSSLLTNTGAGRPSLGGCLVWPFPVDSAALATTVAEIQPLLRQGQGIGFDLSVAPPRLAPGYDTPPIGPNATLLAILAAIGSGGSLKGIKPPAFMASIVYDHPDVFELICLKRDRAIGTVNTSVAVDSLFYRSLDRDGHVAPHWNHDGQEVQLTAMHLRQMNQRAERCDIPPPDLFIDANNNVRSRAARIKVGELIDGKVLIACKAILRAISTCAHECGDPGILNLSAINAANPTHPRFDDRPNHVATRGIGVIHTTAPCGEQPLLDRESCFLGSIDLRRFVRANGLSLRKLRVAAAYAVCMLDDFITASEACGVANEVVVANRKVGIGLMGLADVLAQLELPYSSPQARQVAVQAAEAIQQGALAGSEMLAVVRGAFPNWENSRYAREGSRPRRNATLTTLAPTGHISKIAGCTPSLEPIPSLGGIRHGKLVVHEVLRQKLASENYSLEQWIYDSDRSRTANSWDGTLNGLSSGCTGNSVLDERLASIRRTFVTAIEVPADGHLDMVAAIQKVVENGISKTIVLPAKASITDVSAIFLSALRQELKGITVFRLTHR